MTKIAARIIELFRMLPARDQRALVHHLAETARYDRMTSEQRAELDEALSEVERGETIPAEEAFDDLAQRCGFADA